MTKKFRTAREIEYRAAPYGTIATIPKGTPCVPASNLPDYEEKQQFWAESWEGMSEEAEGWLRGYGFLLSMKDGEVEEHVESTPKIMIINSCSECLYVGAICRHPKIKDKAPAERAMSSQWRTETPEWCPLRTLKEVE